MKINFNEDVFLPKFRPYIKDYNNRYEIHIGGRASGKTVYCVQKLIIKGLLEKRFIILMTKNSNRIKDSVWKELLQILGQWNLTQFFTFNYSEFRATCKLNGTEFKCLGLQEPERFKGLKDVSDVLMDEVSSFTQEDYELVDGTIRSKIYKLPLQLLAAANPVSKSNWIYRYFKYDTGEDIPNTLKTHSTYLDNPHLDKSFHERMNTLKQRNYKRWLIEAQGEFATSNRLVYNNWKVEYFEPRSLKGTLCQGCDFGWTDPFAAIRCIVNEKEKKLYIFEEIYKTELGITDIYNILVEKGWHKNVLIADSADPRGIEDLRRLGIQRIKPSVKGKDSIMAGIRWLQDYEIIIHPSCKATIMEFENYCFQKDKSTGEYIDRPIDEFCHLQDSLRYAVENLRRGKVATYDIKGSLGL